MSILMTLLVALKALARNKLRTALTMLGMIIGVAAVIAMVALGAGAQQSIESQIRSAGTNLIIVSAGNWTTGGVRHGQGASNTLTREDAEAIRTQVEGVQYRLRRPTDHAARHVIPPTRTATRHPRNRIRRSAAETGVVGALGRRLHRRRGCGRPRPRSPMLGSHVR
jgi:hypothetical protein